MTDLIKVTESKDGMYDICSPNGDPNKGSYFIWKHQTPVAWKCKGCEFIVEFSNSKTPPSDACPICKEDKWSHLCNSDDYKPDLDEEMVMGSLIYKCIICGDMQVEESM